MKWITLMRNVSVYFGMIIDFKFLSFEMKPFKTPGVVEIDRIKVT